VEGGFAALQELRREQKRAASWAAEVRPDFVVCCASVPTSAALQELRREQERDALWGANQVHFEKYREEEEEKRRQEQKRAEVRPDFTSGLLCECD
jgi:hypothetical protein